MTEGPAEPLRLLQAAVSRWVLVAEGALPVGGPSATPLSVTCFRLAEIIFLRAITPAHPANRADIIFDIMEGNLRDSFDIIKRYMDGMPMGEWPEMSRSVQTRPLSSERVVLIGQESVSGPAQLPSESPSEV